MLLAIIQIYNYLGATDFALLSVSEINLEYQKYLWLNTLCQLQGPDRQINIKNSLIKTYSTLCTKRCEVNKTSEDAAAA